MLGEDAEDVAKIWTGVRCEMADPRYIGVREEANWGDVVLTDTANYPPPGLHQFELHQSSA